jgi:hypothetical protein
MVGAAVGYFAGLSESPVVATLLPLLFSVLGGSSGLFLVTAKPEEPASMRRLGMLGKALFFFTVAAIFASVYAICLRTGTGLADFIPHWFAEDISSYSIVSKGNTGNDLRIALLDAQLRRLGVNAQDRKLIIAKGLGEMTSEVPVDALQDVETLKVKVIAAFDALQPFVEPRLAKLEMMPPEGRDNEARDDILHPVILDLYKDLKLARRLCLLWTDKDHVARRQPFSRYAIGGLLRNLVTTVNQFEGEHIASRPRATSSMNVFLWLEDQPIAVNTEALLDYQQYIEDLANKYGSGEWVRDDNTSETINHFLETLGKTDSSDPEERRKPDMKP